ncbi:hypothetical protein AB0H36_07105 [Kribbella sp. NPDC050820]
MHSDELLGRHSLTFAYTYPTDPAYRGDQFGALVVVHAALVEDSPDR